MIQPKHDLLVFSKKEVITVVFLLVLVAMLSFTLGLRMGKNLGMSLGGHDTSTHSDISNPPLSEKVEHQTAPAEGHGDSHAEGEHTTAHHEEPAATAHDDAGVVPKVDISAADAKLQEELKKNKVAAERPVITSLPGEKKSVAKPSSAYFTLQIGAYKTLAEATEQVAILKRKGLEEAFYFDAQIPGKGTWYRVGIGTYGSKKLAEDAGKELKSKGQGIPDFIVQRIGE